MASSNRLSEVAKLFFKLGCIGFGGPAAHIAMMEDEVVEKRKWIKREHFLDLIGATNLIPGPNSTELTMHCGRERAGIPGLFVAGFSFIFPAVILTGLLAYLYTEYGKLPEVEPFIFGIKPAVLSIIAAAIFKLSKKAMKNKELILLGIISFIVCFLGVNEIMVLFVTGIIGGSLLFLKSRNTTNGLFPMVILSTSGTIATLKTTTIFLTFLKVGSILYGSGYVLFAYLDAELVEKGLMSHGQLLDAIAVGQFTPGPVLSTATFIGYQLGGWTGALGATLGIFLPSFLFVLILNPLIPRMRRSKFLSFILDSVNIAAVAVMAAVLFQMGKESLMSWEAMTIAILSFIVTFGFKKVNAAFTVLGGSILGYLLLLL